MSLSSLGNVLDDARRRTPAAEALVHIGAAGRQAWTYAELDAAVDRQAGSLAAAGVVAGQHVGVVARRDPALVPTVLALLRLGAVYVPLDPAAPEARWRLYAAEAALAAVVGPADALDRPSLADRRRLCWDDLPSGRPPVRAEGGDRAAYVLFTSGSTGTPKGVLVSHANVVARIGSYLELTDDPVRYLLHSSLCFDGAVGGMYSTLARGGTLVLPEDDAAVDPARAAAVVAAEAVTHLEPVPSWYAALLDLAPPGALDSVRVVILGGEVLPPVLVARHHAKVLRARLFNDYGPTEATVAAAVFEVPPDWSGDRVPIGRPHANTTIEILDDALNPVPVGTVGQLWIGGPGVALGYLGRPDDPAFSVDPRGGRRYASGDLAIWRDDGLLELRGRGDRQVKIRGQRVEPGEVEAALSEVPGVAAAAVAVDRGAGADRLVAYVAPGEGAELTSDGVAAELVRRLPGHLRPELVMVLAALPLTPGGKVDHRALPTPTSSGPIGRPPAPGIETVVAEAFADALDVAAVGADSDFFAVGGHSLAAARVAARLRRLLGVPVAIRDLGDAPTVAGLASVLAGRPPDAEPLPVRRPRAPEPWRVRATPRQESFWFLEYLPGGAGGSNLVELVAFPTGTPLDTLAGAVAALGERHGALRTALVMEDDGLVQVVAPAAIVGHPLVNLGRASSADEVERLTTKFGEEPFALDEAPLVRWGVVGGADGPVVVLVIHHAVADGWSLNLLVDELVAIVSAGGATDALPPVALEYVDVAEHLAARLAGPQAGVAEAHWAARLAEAGDGSTLLPYDRPAAPNALLHAGVVAGRLPPDLVAGLAAVCRQSGATLYQGLLASFGAVLHRASGLDRFVVGGPLSGRGDPELDHLVGCCINTGLFLVDADGDPTFATLVGRVAAAAAGDEIHQWLPTEIPLRVADAAAQHGAVTVLFNLLDAPPRPPADSLAATRRSLACPIAYSDLDVYLEPDGDGLRLEMVYGLARFDPETVERLLQRWLHLLRGAVRRPAQRLSALPVVTPVEVAALRRLEGDAGPAPVGHLLDLVDRSIEEGDERIALVDGDAERSWAWLASRADALASGLAVKGVSAGDRVVLAMDGSADAVALLVACWRLSAVAVPIGARVPAERIAVIAEAAGAAIVVDEGGIAGLTGTGGPRPAERRDPAGPAYVLFTSGSTGQPKGVVVSHRALLASTLARIQAYPGRPPVALVAHDLAFDAALGIITWYLATGGTLVLAGHDARLDPDRVAELVDRHRVGQLDIVPSHYRLLLESVEAARLQSLELVTLGGEACHPSLVAAHQAVVPWARLVNEYGPTESTVWATAHECTDTDVDRERVPIGRPIHGVVVRVADAAGSSVPLGSTGELLLGGHLLADGYLGDPATTAERFPVIDGQRWYRTGDRVRYATDGELEFLGRVDEQVKVRGYRVEPGEVEAVLTELDDVLRAVVDRVDAAGGSEVLAAWVEVAPGSRLVAAAVRAHCRDHLPEWLVPSLVLLVDALPETATGKVDRARLPAPTGNIGQELEPPADEAEATIAAVWRELLGHPVGVDQDFFAIGGHSLLAARMVVRLRHELGIDLDLRELVARPRIRDLAALTRGRERREVGAVADESPGPALLAPNQARLWYLQQLEPDSAAYHETVVLRLEGALDVVALVVALDGLAERHEWLRSGVVAGDGGPCQVVTPAAPAPFIHERLAADDVERWLDRLESMPFDLGAGPLWRTALADVGPEEHILALVLHHLTCDATSLGTLLHELGRRYDAALRSESIELAPMPSPTAIAAELRRRGHEQRTQDVVAARATALMGTDPAARLPADVDDPRGRPAGRVSAELPAALAGAVYSCADAAAVPPFSVFAAAVAAVMARFTGRRDVALGVPVDLRWDLPDADDVVGFLVETAAVPVRGPAEVALVESVGALRDAVADTLAEPVPFEAVVARLRSSGDLPRAGTPLHVYAGWLEGEDAPRLGATGPRVKHLERPLGPAKFDLHWTGVARGPHLTLHLEHDADRISAVTARRLLDHVLYVLGEATAAPGTPMAELLLLPPQEEERLRQFEGTPAPAPEVDLLTELAGSRAAVEAWDDGVWTLVDADEMARRIDDLAAVLVARGVRPGDRVGVSTRRGAGMVVSLLAVLRAGAAFVPIDPGHPLTRQRTVLTLAAAGLVVGSADWLEALEADGVAVDGDGRSGVEAPHPSVWPARRPDSNAYVLFTSGSTGTPKGVVVADSNVVARVRSYADVLGIDPGRYLLHSALGFDASIYLFWALAHGADVVIPPDGDASDPAALARIVADRGVTDTFFVPSLYDLVLAAAGDGLPSLRQVCVGGEIVPAALAARHYEAAPSARFWNVYGPTETVVTATAQLVESPPAPNLPIGRPHPGTVVRVLGEGGRRVPAGAPGEAWIGGPAVATYLDGDGEHFHTDADGVRWYATGDLVRWDDEGRLHFLGRRDRQVKLRGQRVELAEIESALRGLAGVEDAAAEIVGHGSEARLVAVVAPDLPPGEETAARAAVGEILPRGWLPDRIVVAAAVPRLASGKIDRTAVAELLGSTALDAGAGAAISGNPTERGVAAAMAQLLGRDVGPDDDFFDLGGHSLLAARLVAGLEAQLGVTIPLADLLENATPRRLASIADRELAHVWTAPATASLSLLRVGADKGPLVVVARDGETVLYLRHFLRALDADRPLWILLRPAAAFGADAVPDLAAHGRAAAEILAEAFPEGPIHLLGHSASGLVALETARALGERAGATILLDSVRPMTRVDRLLRVLRFVGRLVGSPGTTLRRVRLRLADRHRVVDDAVEIDPLVLRQMRDELDYQAMDRFRMVPYRGETLLVTTEESRNAYGIVDLGWRRWCPDLEVVEIGGDHLGMLMHPLVERTIEVLDHHLASRP